MFFILDEEKKLDIVRDEGRHITYAVLDVFKPKEARNSLITENSSSSSGEDSLEEEQ